MGGDHQLGTADDVLIGGSDASINVPSVMQAFGSPALTNVVVQNGTTTTTNAAGQNSCD